MQIDDTYQRRLNKVRESAEKRIQAAAPSNESNQGEEEGQDQ